MIGTVGSQKRAEDDTLAVIATALRRDRAIPSDGAGALEQLMRVAYNRLAATPRESVDRGPRVSSPRTKRP